MSQRMARSAAALSALRGETVICRWPSSSAPHRPETTAVVMVPVPTNPMRILCREIVFQQWLFGPKESPYAFAKTDRQK